MPVNARFTAPPPHTGMDQPTAPAGRAAPATVADDRALLRAAAELTRDLHRPSPAIYWADAGLSALGGYAALAGAILLHPWPLALGAGLVAVALLYRALLFIHEITHLDHRRLPGFRVAWNMVVGVPLLLPSFMYEGIHTQHHARTRYGTADDPEYLPLALMKPWSLPLFLGAAVLMPVALIVRFAVLTPLSLAVPPLRRVVVARMSGLQMNPAYDRAAPTGDFARAWAAEEAGACLFALALLGTAAAGVLSWRTLGIYVAVVAGVAVLNQLRTLVAHRWENDGPQLTVTGQYLDSTNVPDGALAWLWAPVGLRWHALHHLLPSLPYHALGEAHRRLQAELGPESTYEGANYSSLAVLLRGLAARTMGRERA